MFFLLFTLQSVTNVTLLFHFVKLLHNEFKMAAKKGNKRCNQIRVSGILYDYLLSQSKRNGLSVSKTLELIFRTEHADFIHFLKEKNNE